MNYWMQTAMLVTWTATICILVLRIPEQGPSAMTLKDNNLASNLVQKIETVLAENEHLKAVIFDEIRVLLDSAPDQKRLTKEQPEKATKFMDYVTTTWSEGSWTPSMWNHFGNNGHRTNNHVEGYHHKINKVALKKHLNFDEVVRLLNDDLLWGGDKDARRANYLLDSFWFYLRDKLTLLHNVTSRSQLKQKLNHMRNTADQYHWRIKHKLNNIQDGDGRQKRKWDIMNELGQKVQRRFAYIQNPRNCRTARKYICSPKSCGYGCQLHHMAYCLIMAYGANRTLVLKELDKDSQSWTPFFKPLSESCLKPYDVDNVVKWNDLDIISDEGDPDDVEILLPVLDNIGFRPDYLPLAIPADLAPTLQRFHGNPIAWWIGQVAKYLTRFSDDTQRDLEEYEKKIKFGGPIVGVHVRRTDKLLLEAALHYLDEYMVYVEDYFHGLDIQTGSKVQRKVYLATDEPTVIEESKKYKDYTFIYNMDIIRKAERVTGTASVMMGIVYDIHFLSKTDFLVCTFSSQVCRSAYELMQTKHVDASSSFRSLDDVYYYGGQGPHRMTAVEDHKALSREELSVVKGSDVYIAGNTWTGDVVVRNHGETRNGLVPAYKVKDVVETAQCPLYKEVDLVGS